MLRWIWIFLGLALPVEASAMTPLPQPTVGTEAGLLAGVGGNPTVFRGIPYAAPPVGDLRWRPPRPLAKWAGVRDATQFGPACPESPDSPVMMVGPVGASAEDCLTLNLWKPASALSDAKLPVMVWIHGGGFFTGSGSEAQFDGAPYAARGVILVTVNYRLGRLGFFAHPALDGEDPKALHGNYGLMDIMAALRWVKANVASFGGDPGNVTVFGESAGGISVLALMASPQARGLFQKAIVESGAFPRPMASIASVETLGGEFAKSHGIDGPGTAAALRDLPVETVAPSKPVSPDELGRIQAMAAPMIDGKLFTEDIFASFAHHRQAKVPLLIGSNSLEAVVWLFLPGGKMGTVPIMPADPAKVLGTLGPDKDRLTADYAARFGGDMGKAVPAILTDMTVTAATDFIADQAAASGQPVFRYRFETVPTPLRGLTAGAPHGAEIPYVFGVLDRLRNVGSQTTVADHALSAMVIDYWTSFARTGDPNGTGRPNWPKRDASGALLAFTDAGPVARTADPFAVLFERSVAEAFVKSPPMTLSGPE
jgi:para-nitrobenzyl esterase